jgi:hypothetical protein
MNNAISKKDFKSIWSQLKNSAKKRGIPFDLKLSDIDQIGIPLSCPILGFPIFFHRDKVQDDSISFDRIDSSKGYTLDNLIVISYRANKIKSDATLSELKKIVNFYENL